EAPSIEGSQGNCHVCGYEGENGAITMRGEDRLNIRVLRDITGKPERCERYPDPAQRQRADHHHPKGDWQLLAQPTHRAHVLLVTHRRDDRASTEEQKGLEEGVGEEVENPKAIGAGAQADEHVAELRAGRIGDDLLDVVLNQANGGGEKRGYPAHDFD